MSVNKVILVGNVGKDPEVRYLDKNVAVANFTLATTERSFTTQNGTQVPERTEWRYAEASYKVIALDAGHVCQNLYLACEAIDAGTCAIAAYNQTLADELLGVDGTNEFTVYIAPVGKIPVK